MKKILGVLSSISILSVGGSTVVSCNRADKLYGNIIGKSVEEHNMEINYNGKVLVDNLKRDIVENLYPHEDRNYDDIIMSGRSDLIKSIISFQHDFNECVGEKNYDGIDWISKELSDLRGDTLPDGTDFFEEADGKVLYYAYLDPTLSDGNQVGMHFYKYYGQLTLHYKDL